MHQLILSLSSPKADSWTVSLKFSVFYEHDCEILHGTAGHTCDMFLPGLRFFFQLFEKMCGFRNRLPADAFVCFLTSGDVVGLVTVLPCASPLCALSNGRKPVKSALLLVIAAGLHTDLVTLTPICAGGSIWILHMVLEVWRLLTQKNEPVAVRLAECDLRCANVC